MKLGRCVKPKKKTEEKDLQIKSYSETVFISNSKCCNTSINGDPLTWSLQGFTKLKFTDKLDQTQFHEKTLESVLYK